MDDKLIEQELEAAIAILRLDALDRIYSRQSRPRWAKLHVPTGYNLVFKFALIAWIENWILMITKKVAENSIVLMAAKIWKFYNEKNYKRISIGLNGCG